MLTYLEALVEENELLRQQADSEAMRNKELESLVAALLNDVRQESSALGALDTDLSNEWLRRRSEPADVGPSAGTPPKAASSSSSGRGGSAGVGASAGDRVASQPSVPTNTTSTCDTSFSPRGAHVVTQSAGEDAGVGVGPSTGAVPHSPPTGAPLVTVQFDEAGVQPPGPSRPW